MYWYILRRLGQAILTLVFVVSVVFVLTRSTGSPASLMAPPYATIADIEAIAENLGLNEPLLTQYWRYLVGLAQGDLGTSFSFNASVRDLLIEAFPNTAILAAAAYLFATIAGVGIGFVAAMKRGGLVDRAAKSVALVGQSVPSFFAGIVLVMVFAVQLDWLPPHGRGGLRHLVLPALSLGLLPLAEVMRLTRSATLEVLKSEFVLYERSKGVRPRVLISHIGRNAFLPVLTLSGVQLGQLLSGAVVIEVLFAWPGIGRLAIDAIHFRDYSVVQGVVLLGTAIFVFLNLIVDLTYGLVDPRVTQGVRSEIPHDMRA